MLVEGVSELAEKWGGVVKRLRDHLEHRKVDHLEHHGPWDHL